MTRKKPKFTVIIVTCLVIAVFLTLLVLDFKINSIEPTYTSVSVALDDIHSNKVYALFKVEPDEVWYVYKQDVKEDADTLEPPSTALDLFELTDADKWYSTNLIVTENLYDELCSLGVHYYTSVSFDPYTERGGTVLVAAISALLPLILVVALWQSMTKSGMIKNDEVKSIVPENTKDILFTNVIGHEEIIEDLRQYIKILKNSKALADSGIHQPRGLLLSGPPGTGKTLLAKALANEAELPFIYANSSEMIDRFVGVGALNVRKYFKRARELAPCILFLDELDAIGCSRSNRRNGTSEDNQTLLALLQELDGFTGIEGVLVIGATNMADELDPALRRAGRFDREIRILPPKNRQTREKLIELYTKKFELNSDVNISSLAGQMQGLTGADIAFICNEAAILAAVRDSEKVVVTSADFASAMDKLLLKGNHSAANTNKKDKQIAAYHEAGHAVTAFILGQKIGRISVQENTSGVGGYVIQEDSNSFFQTKTQIINQVKICYGGRCAEVVLLGEDNVTTGAVSDIQQATAHLLSLVTAFGCDASAGLVDYKQLITNGISNEHLLDDRVRELANSYYEDTLALVKKNFALVTALAERLLEVGELSGDEAESLLASG